MKKLRLLSILVVISIGLLLPSVSLALVLPSTMSIPDVKVFRNLLETGDMLYVFEYNIAYSSDNYTPTENVSASESFVFRLYNTDNVTSLANSTPYTFSLFETNGYSHGVSAFYFVAGDTKPTWGSAAKIELYGSTTYFTPAQSCNLTVTAVKYTSYSTQAQNQAALKKYVLVLAERLNGYYHSTGVLLNASAGGVDVLSAAGESYLRGAIDGLQTFCPDLFEIQVYVPTAMAPVSYNMSLQDTYTARHAAGAIGTSLNDIGSRMGVSGAFAGAGIFIVTGIAITIWTTTKGWGAEIGMLISALIGIFGAIMLGSLLFTIMMIISLLAGMGLVWLLLLKRT